MTTTVTTPTGTKSIADINAAREAAFASGGNPYGGNGATTLSTAVGLSPAVAPTNAKDVVPSGSLINLPTLSLSPGNPGPAVANTNGISKGLDTGQAYFDQQMKFLQAKQDTTAANKTSFLSGLVKPSDSLDASKKLLKDAGVDPIALLKEKQGLIEETNTLSKQYADLSAQKDADLNSIRTAAGGTVEGVTASLGAAERNANIRLNALSSRINANNGTLNALSGQYTQAMSYINQAADEATANNKYAVDQFTLTENQNKDLFDNLSSTYKEAWNIAKTDATQKYNENRDNHKQIASLFEAAAKSQAPASVLNYLSGLVSKSDLTADDIASAYKTTGSYASGTKPDANGNFTDSQINNGASSASVPLATFKTFSTDLKNLFINNNAFAKDWAAFKGGADGAPNYDDFVAEINKTNSIAAEDKATLIGLLTKPTEKSGGAWQAIKDFFTR